jgi:pilus assembly protein FimV
MASSSRARRRTSYRPRGTRFGLIALLVGGLGGFAAQSFALGLGEIEIDSALNERLQAVIPLIDVGDLQPDEIRVKLASQEDFQRVGVEPILSLGDLRFQVELGAAGGIVRVSSERPITEPFLNFLVHLQWPQGRLLKEFTLLLDPPTFSQAAAPAVRSAVQAAPDVSTAGVIERQSEPAFGSAPATAVSRPATGPLPGAGERVGDEYRMGSRPETLWSIASQNRPSTAVSIQQTMLAIQRLNPDAFVDGNINRLKAAQTLRLPSEDEARAVGAAEALEQVALQDRNWRTGSVADAAAPVPTERAAIDATPRAEAPAATADTEGRLRIVAGSGDSVTGTPEVPAADSAAERAALAAALEERDRLNLEVADLTSQLDREKELAANQLAVKDRQLEVKDQQIAEIQAELARLRDSADVAAVEESQDQSVSRPATAWWQAPGVLGAGAGVVVLLLAGGLIAARRRRTAAPDADFAVPVAVQPATPPPADVARAAAAVPLAAAGGLAAGALARTTDAQAEVREADDAGEAVVESDEPVRTDAVPGVVIGAATLAADDQLPAEAVSDLPPEPAQQAAGDVASDELVDVVGEADIYIAYGRFGQASTLLQNALVDDPDHHEARLKLLEIFAETGDQAAFDREHAELVSRCQDTAMLGTAAALAAQIGGAAASAADAMPTLDDLERAR